MKRILILLFVSQLSLSGNFKKTKTIMFANHISTKRGKDVVTITYECNKTYQHKSFNLKNSSAIEKVLTAKKF